MILIVFFLFFCFILLFLENLSKALPCLLRKSRYSQRNIDRISLRTKFILEILYWLCFFFNLSLLFFFYYFHTFSQKHSQAFFEKPRYFPSSFFFHYFTWRKTSPGKVLKCFSRLISYGLRVVFKNNKSSYFLFFFNFIMFRISSRGTIMSSSRSPDLIRKIFPKTSILGNFDLDFFSGPSNKSL